MDCAAIFSKVDYLKHAGMLYVGVTRCYELAIRRFETVKVPASN